MCFFKNFLHSLLLICDDAKRFFSDRCSCTPNEWLHTLHIPLSRANNIAGLSTLHTSHNRKLLIDYLWENVRGYRVQLAVNLMRYFAYLPLRLFATAQFNEVIPRLEIAHNDKFSCNALG